MKNVKGITLIALIITIIVLLILAGIALNSLMGKDGIINNAISGVDKANITADKERIQLAVIELITEKKQLTVDNIVDKLIEKGITTEANVNRDTNQVKTDKGYIFDININENGGFEVGYVGKGELAKSELEVTITKDAGVLTTKVTLTITAKSDSGIATYTNHDGDTKTYTNNEKEISEKYEVTANGTYNFTVKNKKGTSETKSIEISNILEGTVTIIPSRIDPTNEDITVEVTWPSDTTGFTKEISKNDGETWDEYTGIVTVEGNCVVKARLLDSAGGVARTATLDVQNIDKTNPTVTANEETVTITEADEHDLGEYFTVVANGKYGIASTVYTDTSNGNAVVTNTNTLAVGTHVIKCTVTKETGASANASVTIVVESESGSESKTILELYQSGELDIGDFVTYTMGDTDYINAKPFSSSYAYVKDSEGNAVTGWRIFDIADDGSVTLISAGNPENYAHGTDAATSVTAIESLASKYENSRYDTAGVAMLNKTILAAWYSKYIMNGVTDDTLDNSTFQKVYGTKYETMIDNYSLYWLATAVTGRTDIVHYIWPQLRWLHGGKNFEYRSASTSISIT